MLTPQTLLWLFKLTLEQNSALAVGPSTLQGNQFTSYNEDGHNSLNLFCDYIGGVATSSNSSRLPGADGVGLKKALDGYVQYMKERLEGCKTPLHPSSNQISAEDSH